MHSEEMNKRRPSLLFANLVYVYIDFIVVARVFVFNRKRGESKELPEMLVIVKNFFLLFQNLMLRLDKFYMSQLAMLVIGMLQELFLEIGMK